MSEDEAVQFLRARGYLVRMSAAVLARHGDEVERRYLAGENCREIAEAYGVTAGSVYLILKRAGVTRRPSGTHPKTARRLAQETRA